MPSFEITDKRPRINFFKLSGAYYFKQFFDDPELFRELEPYYEKQRYRFKMATAGERNKVMKLLDRKGYDFKIHSSYIVRKHYRHFTITGHEVI